MEDYFLGRTNKYFPPLWVSLQTPSPFFFAKDVLDPLLARTTVIDFSSNPVLFGNVLRGRNDLILKCSSSSCLENAIDESHAFNLIQAELIQNLCAIGRSRIDFFMLTIRSSLEEFQISGALHALEQAIQEGNVGYTGLKVTGSPLSTLALWQFRDGFDVIEIQATPDSHASLEAILPLASARRVGIVIKTSDFHFIEDLEIQVNWANSFGTATVPIANPSSAKIVSELIDRFQSRPQNENAEVCEKTTPLLKGDK